jgi:ribosomal protein L28
MTVDCNYSLSIEFAPLDIIYKESKQMNSAKVMLKDPNLQSKVFHYRVNNTKLKLKVKVSCFKIKWG